MRRWSDALDRSAAARRFLGSSSVDVIEAARVARGAVTRPATVRSPAMAIAWHYFPESAPPPSHLVELVAQFEVAEIEISSATLQLNSNAVLAALRPGLTQIGYQVEASKASADKIRVPVLFGRNGRVQKAFDADAYHPAMRTVLEIEAGRGVDNNQFLKDLFQACMMVDVDFLAIAVRNTYRGNKDFERVATFFETLYASQRLALPLEGVLIVGY